MDPDDVIAQAIAQAYGGSAPSSGDDDAIGRAVSAAYESGEPSGFGGHALDLAKRTPQMLAEGTMDVLGAASQLGPWVAQQGTKIIPTALGGREADQYLQEGRDEVGQLFENQAEEVRAANPPPEITGFNMESLPGFAYELGTDIPPLLAAEATMGAGMTRVAPGMMKYLRPQAVAESRAAQMGLSPETARLTGELARPGLLGRMGRRSAYDAMLGVPYSLAAGHAFEEGESGLPGIVEDPIAFGALGPAFEVAGTAIRGGYRHGIKNPVRNTREALARARSEVDSQVPRDLPTHELDNLGPAAREIPKAPERIPEAPRRDVEIPDYAERPMPSEAAPDLKPPGHTPEAELPPDLHQLTVREFEEQYPQLARTIPAGTVRDPLTVELEAMTPNALAALTHKALGPMLRARRLPLTGNKAQKVARLVSRQRSEAKGVVFENHKRYLEAAVERGEKIPADVQRSRLDMYPDAPPDPTMRDPRVMPPPKGGPQRQPSPVESAMFERPAAEIAAPKPVVAEGLHNIPVRRGRKTEVITSEGKDGAVYALAEARDLVPSHNPRNGFEPNPRYPAGVQERPYHRDRSEQMKVVKNAQNQDPRYTQSDDPTPVNGPPMVRRDGLVEGGNSRVMAIQLAYDNPEYIAKYRTELPNRAASYGLDPADVAKMDEPVLIRLLDDLVEDPKDMAVRVRRYNEVPTQELAQTSEAVSAANRVSNETMGYIGETMGPEQTIRDWLSNEGVQSEITRRLMADGVFTPQNVNAYTAGGKFLNDKGKAYVERVFLGKAIPDADVLETAPAAAINKISKSVHSIARAAELGEEWDVRQEVVQALRLARDAQSNGMAMKDYLAQIGMFENAIHEPRVLAIWDHLENSKAVEVRKIFGRYAGHAAKGRERALGQTEMGILLEESPTLKPSEAFAEAFAGPPKGNPTRILGEAGAVTPELMEWMVRGSIGGTAEIMAQSLPEDQKRWAYALHALAIIAGGPAINKAMRKTGMHPGDAFWRMLVRGGDATRDMTMNYLAKHFGEGDAFRVMQFLSYEYGVPRWLNRAMIAREVGYENDATAVIDWVRKNLNSLPDNDRIEVTSLIRQVEQAREGVTAELERVKGLRRLGLEERQQSNLFNPADPITDVELDNMVTALLEQRERATARAWAGVEGHRLGDTARKLVEQEDRLSDRLIDEGMNPAVFERFRNAHLTRAYEKWLDPESPRLAEAFPGSDSPIRDPAHWSERRQAIPKDIRTKLGEIHDAAVLFAKGQTDKLYSLYTRRLYREMANGVTDNGLPLVARQHRTGYVQLPNSPALGDLAGQYAHGSIAWSLKALHDPRSAGNRIWESIRGNYLKLLGHWKSGKTAWSPWTQGRNVMSNGMLLHMGGMDMFDPRNTVIFMDALRTYGKAGQKSFEEAKAAGVFRGSFFRAEVEELRQAARSVSGEMPFEKIAGMLGGGAKRLMDKPGEIYQGSEHVFKFAKFLYNRRQGMSVAEAADDAVANIFDYSAIPGIVKWYRSFPLGAPFITFTYKAIPKLAEFTAKNPDKVASLLAVFAFVEHLSGREPITHESEELIHPWLRSTYGHLVPPGARLTGLPGVGPQALQLPFETDQGVAAANLQFLMPYGSVVPDRPDAERPLLSSIPPIFRPANPFLNLPIELLQNRSMFTGQPIVEESEFRDPWTSKAATFGEHAFEALAPNLAQVPGLVADAASGDLPWGGLAAQMVGMKPVFIDPEKGHQIETHRLNRELDEIEADRRRDMYDARQSGGTLTDDERREISERFRARRTEIRARKREITEALRRAREAGY